jgi:hypothetical protein
LGPPTPAAPNISWSGRLFFEYLHNTKSFRFVSLIYESTLQELSSDIKLVVVRPELRPPTFLGGDIVPGSPIEDFKRDWTQATSDVADPRRSPIFNSKFRIGVWDREVKKKEKVKGKRVILRNLTQGLIYTMRALP